MSGLLEPSSTRPGPRSLVQQPPYMFGTTQVEVFLKVNTVYYIVPSLFKRKQAGRPHTIFFIMHDVYGVMYVTCLQSV